MKKLALPLLVFAVGIFTDACSGGGGGGNGAEPCCGATGETVPPSSGFAGGGAERFAQVVVFDTSSSAVCPTVATGGIDLTAIQLDAASPARRVETSGAFELEIDDEFVGRQLFVRVFDGEDATLSRGMGPLGSRTTEGATIPVAPILFDSTTFGESTVEGVIACLFQTGAVAADQFQNMTFADVRSFVTEDMARALQSGGEGGIHQTAKSYRHGVNGLYFMVVATNGTPTKNFNDLRADAELFGDRCKLRDPSSPAECTTETDSRVLARVGDSYRFWYLTRHALDAQYGITWDENVEAEDPALRRLQAFAEDAMLELLQIDSDNTLDETNPIQVAAYRNNQLLRYEIAEVELRRAFTCYESVLGPDASGECSDGSIDPALRATGTLKEYPSLEESLAALQAVLVGGSTVQDTQDAWALFASDVSFNFGIQANPTNYTDQGGNPWSDAVTNAANAATAVHFDLLTDGTQHQTETTRNIDWTNEAIRARLYDATNTESSAQGAYQQISTATVAMIGEPEPLTLADVLFYAHVNVRP